MTSSSSSEVDEGLSEEDSFLRKVAALSERPPPVADPDRVGERFGKYVVVERLGAGGMGVVYRARDESLGRDVALKLLRARGASEATARKRFVHEARAASAVRHENVASVFEVGEVGDEAFLAMELVPGQSLGALLEARGALPVEEARRIATEVARALEAAHASGIVHRDLKPDNVMIEPDGRVKVLDFGLARRLPTDDAAHGSEALTMDGHILGTPGYMSPEQVAGLRADARSDVFSLGVLLYEMLVGERPFAGRTKMETLVATSRDPAPSVAKKRPVPRALAALVARMLEKDPAARPATVREVREALSAEARTPLRAGLVVALGVALAGAVSLAIVWSRPRPASVPEPLPASSFASEATIARPADTLSAKSAAVEPSAPVPSLPSEAASSAPSARPSARQAVPRPSASAPTAPSAKRDPLADQK